ncbi:unnamed protein product [Sphagnum balticum]
MTATVATILIQAFHVLQVTLNFTLPVVKDSVGEVNVVLKDFRRQKHASQMSGGPLVQVILGIFCHWILKQDALGNVSGIWVLLATMASLHVGLYSSIAEEELSGNLMHGLNSTNQFLVDVLVMHWACTDSGNFIGSCKCQC